jgi:hypothetical protein
MTSHSYKANYTLSDSLSEISKTLDNLKSQRFSLDKEIENEELYKEKLLEKLKNYQNEHNRIIGKISNNLKIVWKTKQHC